MKRAMLVALAAAVTLVVVAAIALAGGAGAPEPQPDRRLVPAPIDAAEIVTQRSLPVQYLLVVKAGLPSGCAQRASHEVKRTGDRIEVAVWNSLQTGDPVCTMIYGTYDLSIPLGSDFRPGATYTVQVNDRTLTFTAR